jgi:hypothetical protein
MSFNPVTIMPDFEDSLAEVIRGDVSVILFQYFNSNMQLLFFFIYFPNSNHIGCYFHFSHAIYRNIQQHGLSAE